MKSTIATVTLALFAASAGAALAADPVKVLLVGGQNNHNWKRSNPILEAVLTESPRFEVAVSNSPEGNASKEAWDAWKPNFAAYDCVVLNYNGAMWPDARKTEFEKYIAGGGGALVIHAANNSFTGWEEYEKMVGLLWRPPIFGSSLYYDNDGKVVYLKKGEGSMGHGGQYDWVMTTREKAHPITKGLPETWMHKHDELYHGQRGKRQHLGDLKVLLTAYSDSKKGGTGRHEPIVWTKPYGKGAVVTNVMGHVGGIDCLRCSGFQTIMLRACEWLATQKVTQEVPDDFPTAKETSVR